MPATKSSQAICNHVVRLLHHEREQRGLSIYAVADRSGLAQQTISYIERGMRRPSLETVIKLANGIGVDLAEIIKAAQTAARPKRS